MEFVNIGLLYESMFMAIKQCAGTGMVHTSHETCYMQILACLIGLTGTDFTRNLPLMGVKKLWSLLAEKNVWAGVLQSFDVQYFAMDPDAASDLLVARVYLENYRKHISGVSSSLNGVLGALARCPKLSDRTKTLLPSESRVQATIRNINWLLRYWACDQPCRTDPSENWSTPCPDPITEEYGFKMNPHRKHAVVWADEA